MKIDVAGRIRNVTLPKSRPLLPLYEAIINSIQAIEDAKEKNGKITIKFTRDTSAQMYETEKAARDIRSFEVVDNGVGFTEENFEAFQTSDTTYKADRGGKGIGRFMWLVAFDSVEVSSTFKGDGGWKTRSFKFVPQGKGVADEQLVAKTSGTRSTSVRLLGFKKKFSELGPKKLDTIAAYIVEHCLEYLIRPSPPHIELIDETNDQRIDLNEVYDREMKANAKPVKFKVHGVEFEMLHVRLYSTHIEEHLVHYCADHRAVKAEKLAGRVPDLAKRLTDEDGRQFVYASYVDSPLLNQSVNEERTDFNVSSDDSGMFPDDLTWAQVRDAAVQQSQKYLADYTKPVRVAKDKRIEEFVATEAPMYRPILKHVEQAVGMIDPDIDNDKLDLELYRAYHDLLVKLRAEGQELLKTQPIPGSGFDQYAAQFEDYFEKISDASKADLARYVFHRRLVLDFLHKLLGLQDDGKYPLEDRVHQLIFPMGETSASVFAERHNLWLVDERLAYHKFLASDVPLRSLTPLSNKSGKEPDIIVFDTACAFVSQPDEPFQTVTIIEFKRPRRTTYDDKENPIRQIREYIQKLRSGKAKTPTGHEVAVSPAVHFYCFIIADKADKLDDIAKGAQLDPTPDGQGYFGYLKHENAYVEIMSYQQMLTNAKQRNGVFFDKLGVPCTAPVPATGSVQAAMGSSEESKQ
jgi:hypothetical protein